MGEYLTLKYDQTIMAPARDIYYYVTNGTGFREWLCDGGLTRIEPDGFIFLWWNGGYTVRGAFSMLEEPHEVSFSWHGSEEPTPTTITIKLVEESDATLMTLIHQGIPDEWSEAIREFNKGWQDGLENLKSIVEHGVDLRLSRRPMLGLVGAGAITPENAAAYNLPADAVGQIVNSTVEGLGAEQAGLHSQDVLFRVNGVSLKNFDSFAVALKDKQAGDVVEVEFYRDGQPQKLDMVLSSRPAPDIPDDPERLAEKIQVIYDDFESQLDAVLQDVTDQEASQRREEGSWNVKEVLCHLIVAERFYSQNWLATLATGREPVNYVGDEKDLHAMLLRVDPTLDDVRRTLSRSFTESVAQIATLPESFTVDRKAAYYRAGSNLLLTGFHLKEHLHQIVDILDAD